VSHRTKSQQEILDSDSISDFSADVTAGLGSQQKFLSSKYFYDKIGSELFEQISALPEYYVTRTEAKILQDNSSRLTRIIDRSSTDSGVDRGICIVELGSGSSAKTRILLRQLVADKKQVCYFPIDISRTILCETASRLKNEFPSINTLGVPAHYDFGIDQVSRIANANPSTVPKRKLILFLGSSIGNFEKSQAISFLRMLREKMDPKRDMLLVGFDLHKKTKILNAAYNDSRGITAKFNFNLLTRINRELDGNFVLERFTHGAFYNRIHRRIEMHLISKMDQSVYIGASGKAFEFRRGESIHTENSYKYSIGQIRDLAKQSGLEIQRNFVDSRQWFSLTLFRTA